MTIHIFHLEGILSLFLVDWRLFTIIIIRFTKRMRYRKMAPTIGISFRLFKIFVIIAIMDIDTRWVFLGYLTGFKPNIIMLYYLFREFNLLMRNIFLVHLHWSLSGFLLNTGPWWKRGQHICKLVLVLWHMCGCYLLELLNKFFKVLCDMVVT